MDRPGSYCKILRATTSSAERATCLGWFTLVPIHYEPSSGKTPCQLSKCVRCSAQIPKRDYWYGPAVQTWTERTGGLVSQETGQKTDLQKAWEASPTEEKRSIFTNVRPGIKYPERISSFDLPFCLKEFASRRGLTYEPMHEPERERQVTRYAFAIIEFTHREKTAILGDADPRGAVIEIYKSRKGRVGTDENVRFQPFDVTPYLAKIMGLPVRVETPAEDEPQIFRLPNVG